MKEFSQIKEDFFRGKTTYQQAKEELFKYSPHFDAIESNNEVLRMWAHLLKIKTTEQEAEEKAEEEAYSNRDYMKAKYERDQLNNALTAAQQHYHSR
jgi:hypothetical protein